MGLDNSQVQGGAASKLKKKRLRAEAAAFLALDQCAGVLWPSRHERDVDGGGQERAF